MEIKEIQVITNSTGDITCGDIGITTAEWYQLLRQPQSSKYLEVLYRVVRMPQHRTSCEQLSEAYDQSPHVYQQQLTAFGQWVEKMLHRFKVVGGEATYRYFAPLMSQGKTDKNGRVWQLRDELTTALQQLLIEELIRIFDQQCQQHPFADYDETYKWALINKDHQVSTLEIIKSLKGVNIVSNMHVDGTFKDYVEHQPENFVACVDRLFDETQTLDTRLYDFKVGMKNLAAPDSKKLANDERTAAALLTCKYPEKYTVYMDSLYQLICSYLGVESKKAGHKYSHYLEIIRGISARYGEQIQAIISKDIAQFDLRPVLLATQTLFWCMQDEMEKRTRATKRNIWMVGCYIEKDLKEDFKAKAIWQGQFNDDSTSDQELLKIARTFKKDDLVVLKATGTKGVNHDQSFLRIKGVGIITGEMTFTTVTGATIGSCPVTYLPAEETDFEGGYYGSYNKSINPINPRHKEILNYIYSLLTPNNMQTSRYEKYIQLLKSNKNLVLTGAPGTGKTYMAQAIAKAMNAETALVQFHPSYDYTDFVEGLRPLQDQQTGQIGFERKDGVFKAFCKQAAQNLIDSRKSMETWQKENDWKTKLGEFASDAMENRTNLQLLKGGHFTIENITENTITVYNPENEKTPNIAVSVAEILTLLNEEVPLNNVHDVRDFFHRNLGTQADSYVFVITNAIRKTHQSSSQQLAPMVEQKDFVFIIDEVNRGEASKIFGELFYAIDPGYREDLLEDTKGSRKLVQTQYQNLVPETDLFAKGFYVPENVYILATMNDIDRSVESMDFAMRRRFTWKEVTPEETEYMLEDNLDAHVLPEALAKLHRLNTAISEADELGAAYQIGPSYFLKLADHNHSFEALWSLNLEPLLKEYLRGIRKANDLLTKFHAAYLGEDSDQNHNAEEG